MRARNCACSQLVLNWELSSQDFGKVVIVSSKALKRREVASWMEKLPDGELRDNGLPA